MSDTYQAIYDAVRSRISGGDIGSAAQDAMRDAFNNATIQVAHVAESYTAAAFEQQRPSTIFRPSLTIDGNKWCALYGDNLQDGVAGFGDTPDQAMRDFDAAWCASLSAQPAAIAAAKENK